MGLRVTSGSVDITPYVQEETIQIKDALGQGGGTGGFAVGRASTASFITTLGPVAQAVGAGSNPQTPKLTRMAEIRIYDANNVCVFGGYAGKLSDKTEYTRIYTQVDCYDYWQHLDRILVTTLFTTATDISIIKSLCSQYAPWLNLSLVPLAPNYTFSTKNYKGQSLQKILADITNVTGFYIWIDNDKFLHYNSPSAAPLAPFSLSTHPNFATAFPLNVTDLEIDDNSAITRVTFFGGRQPSNDFTQDLSPQVNGSNKLFILAYYPRASSNGKIDVKVNGVSQTMGYLLGTGEVNKFKSAGGLADVLLNADAHTLTFDVAPANGATVNATYRYEYPMIIQIEDQAAYRLYGMHLDGVISDDTVFDRNTAVSRCRVLLSQQSQGLLSFKASCWKSGLTSGMILNVFHSIRGINGSFLIQEVSVSPLGAGHFHYDLTLGAWRWDLTDTIMNAIHKAVAPESTSSDNGQSTSVVDIFQVTT
jgi:hypothetical protein